MSIAIYHVPPPCSSLKRAAEDPLDLSSEPISKEAKSSWSPSEHQRAVDMINALPSVAFLEFISGGALLAKQLDGSGPIEQARSVLASYPLFMFDHPNYAAAVQVRVTFNEYKLASVNTDFMSRHGFVSCKSCGSKCVPVSTDATKHLPRPSGYPRARRDAPVHCGGHEVRGVMLGEERFYGGWLCVNARAKAEPCWNLEAHREADHNDYVESLVEQGRMQDVQALMQAFEDHYADQPEVTDAYVNDDPPYVTVVEPSGREVVLVLD